MGRRRAKTETEEEKKMQKCRQGRDKGEERGNIGGRHRTGKGHHTGQEQLDTGQGKRHGQWQQDTGQGKGITRDSSNWTQGRERDTGQRQQDMCSQAEATRERITDCPEGTYIDPGEYNSPDLTVGEEVTTRWGQ